jgi:hypothetical protein
MSQARAAESGAPIAIVLSIEGTGECMQRDSLYAAVRQRSARLRFVEPGTSDLTREQLNNKVRLTVNPAPTTDGSSWRAEVELRRAGAHEPIRTLETPDCASLTDAVGFIVALTFDPPHDSRTSNATSSVPTSDAPSSDPTSDATSSAPSVTASEPPRATLPASPRDDEQTATPTNSAGIAIDVGAAFEVVTEAGPLVQPGFGLGFHAAAEPDPGVSWSFAAQLQLSAFPGRTSQHSSGEARFRMLSGRLGVCPLAIHFAVFTLRPCGSATLGALQTTGTATNEPEDHTRPWSSVGGGLWAGVNVTERLRIDLDAGFGATLVRDAFQFAPDIFYRTPATTARAAAGLSVLLP